MNGFPAVEYADVNPNRGKQMNHEISDAQLTATAVVDAERGDADAQAYLGISHTYGWNGCRLDQPQALHWFRLASAQENPDGDYNLACMLDIGSGGVRRDPAEARRLYARAAAHGHTAASEMLDAEESEDAE